MLKLYFAPGACSLSPHIALREAGLAFELDRVDFATKTTAAGENFLAVNPRGYVPALRVDASTVLIEGPAIVQYIADQNPGSNLAPANGTIARYELQGWLAFLNSEVHKPFGVFFNPKADDAAKASARGALTRRFEYLNGELTGRTHLMGDTFTVADGYLFVLLGWTKYTGYDLAPFPSLQSFVGRVFERPAVQAAMKAEGLIKE